MPVGQNPQFAVKRLLVMVGLVLPLGAIALSVDCSPLFFVVLVFGTWPFPFRCSIHQHGLEIRWLVLRHRLPLDSNTRYALIPDPRRCAIRRSTALSIMNPGKSPVLLFASRPVLESLSVELSSVRGIQAGSAV